MTRSTVSNSDGVAFTNNKPALSLKAMLLPGVVKSTPIAAKKRLAIAGKGTSLVSKPVTVEIKSGFPVTLWRPATNVFVSILNTRISSVGGSGPGGLAEMTTAKSSTEYFMGRSATRTMASSASWRETLFSISLTLIELASTISLVAEAIVVDSGKPVLGLIRTGASAPELAPATPGPIRTPPAAEAITMGTGFGLNTKLT